MRPKVIAPVAPTNTVGIKEIAKDFVIGFKFFQNLLILFEVISGAGFLDNL